MTGYEGLKRDAKAIPPEARDNLADALDRLVALFEAVGKAAEAATWRRERYAAAEHLPAPRPAN